MERETRLVSCSLAFNGNSVFCFQGLQPLQQKHSSLSSLTQLALSLVRRHLIKANKKDPSLDESFLLAGDEARTRDILLGKEAFYHWITPAGYIIILHAHFLKSRDFFLLFC